MTSGREPAPLPGQIGPYEVLQELGRGGMGVVYLAHDPRLERRVAIKTLSEELSRDEEWNARFSREARLLASLNHPNIATIYSLEREGDLVYLTMELIPGQSLESLIQSGSLTLPDALSICRQIARGLEAAHGAGVIHRDLKPLNVMITPESHAKMLDFGLATRASASLAAGPAAPPPSGNASGTSEVADATAFTSAARGASDAEAARPRFDPSDDATAVEATAVSSDTPRDSTGSEGGRESGSGSGARRVTATTGAGTPGYMSPEQIRGEELDARTDLWAFGCVLYESLSGVRAFRGSTAQERIRSSLKGAADPRDLPPQTPESIRQLIRSCLQSDREERLGNASQARQVLEAALAQRSWDPAVTEVGGAIGGAAGRAPVPHNLPNEVTPLVGRVREVAQVGEMLARGRLVTLTGVGGGGKTRLALRVSRESLESFSDGAWMVELAPVTESAGVLRAAAKCLGVAESAGQPLAEAVVAHLAGRSLLLILDNCEHVVQACAELAGSLLSAAPRLKILTTSREMLGLPGESVFQVPPLEVPPAPAAIAAVPTGGASSASSSFEVLAGVESVRLFSQRAAQVRSDFRLRPENIEEIAGICRRLEGIPLALELAAARTKALSLAEIARRLEDRFRLLKATSRSSLPHHQTLEALIDWSHASLTESEQRLFRRLSLFRGGWTLEAAETVCPDSDLEPWEVLDALTRLIDKSLVVFTPVGGSAAVGSSAPAPAAGGTESAGTEASGRGSPRPAEPRYHMLETVREYAQARLGHSEEAGAAKARFLDYFVTLADAAAQQLTGPAQSAWLGRLDAEIDNVRAAIVGALEGEDPVPALRLTGQMLRYWMIRAQWREGRAALERVIGMPGADEHAGPLGVALNALGSCCYQLNDLEAAATHYQRAVNMCIGTSERRRAGPPLINLGNVHRLRGEFDQAVASLTEALRCFDESDQWMIAAIQMNLGSIALMREQYDEARARYETAIGMFRKLGDRVHTAMSAMNLGLVAYRQGRLPEARSLLGEGAVIFEELGDRNFGANAQVNLAIVLLATGELAEASRIFAKALRAVRETGNLENVAACLEGLCQIARTRGDIALGGQLAGAAEAIRTRFGLVRHPVDQRQWEAENRAYALEVGEEVFARHLAEGLTLELEAAVALALKSETETT